MGSKVADSHGVDKARKQSAQAKHAPTGLHAAQPSTPMDHVRVVAKKIMDSNYFSAFMTVLTIYALFGDDMKLTLTDVTADGGFVVAAWICVFFFSFEIQCNIFANPFYLWGFYFWIDLVSTLSILMEIPMVMDPLTGEMGGASGSSAEMAKAGKAGRVGTKASKVIRIVRLVRMVRVVKLYKMHNGADDAMQDTSLEPSSVGKKLTEITTQRLICMMLVMIMALPWLQSGSLLSNNFNFQYHFLKHLHQYPQNFNRTGADGSPLVSEADFRQQVRYYARKSYQDGYPLLYLEICEPQTETGVYGGPYSWANCNTTWTHDAIHDMVSSDSNEWGSFMERPDKGIGMNGFEGADKRGESVIDKLNYRDSASGEFFQITQVGCYRASGEDDLYGGIKNWEPAGGKMPGEGEHHKAWDIRVEQPTCISFAIFSNREKMRLLSGMSLLKTLFIMIMIVGGSLAFNHDAQIFVIGPIERMMTLVRRGLRRGAGRRRVRRGLRVRRRRRRRRRPPRHALLLRRGVRVGLRRRRVLRVPLPEGPRSGPVVLRARGARVLPRGLPLLPGRRLREAPGVHVLRDVLRALRARRALRVEVADLRADRVLREPLGRLRRRRVGGARHPALLHLVLLLPLAPLPLVRPAGPRAAPAAAAGGPAAARARLRARRRVRDGRRPRGRHGRRRGRLRPGRARRERGGGAAREGGRAPRRRLKRP